MIANYGCENHRAATSESASVWVIRIQMSARTAAEGAILRWLKKMRGLGVRTGSA